MPKRSADDAGLDGLWDLHMDEIVSLYRKASIEEVMKLMEERHAFRKKKHEYAAHLREWGVTKNVRKHEWDYIIPRYNERMKENKNTVVRVHGVEISQKRIKKEEKRSQRQLTTFERLRMQREGVPRAKTPPGVVVRSPTPTSPQIYVRSSPLSNTAPSFSLGSFPTFDFELRDTIKLPWLSLIKSPTFLTSIEKKSYQSLTGSEDLGRLVFRPLGFWDPVQSSYCSRQVFQPYASNTPFLPTSLHNPTTNPHPTNSNAVSTEFSYFDILKTVFGVISNNQHKEPMVWDLVELAIKQKQVFTILASFLRLQQPSTIAFAEKLLPPAIDCGSIPLVSLILSSGVDASARFLHPGTYYYTTALQFAIKAGHEEIFELLYAKIGRQRCTKCPCENDSCDCKDCMSHIHYAIEGMWGSVTVLNTVIRLYKADNIFNRNSILYSLRVAVAREELDRVHCLFDAFPETLQYARENPLFLLEAAAYYVQDCFMFDNLTEMGLQLHGGFGHAGGSVLTMAILGRNKPLVVRLLITLSNDELSNYSKLSERLDQRFCFRITERDKELVGSRCMSALMAAVGTSDAETVELLLARGFTFQASDNIHPLQLAAWQDSPRIVQMVIDHGFGHFSHSLSPSGGQNGQNMTCFTKKYCSEYLDKRLSPLEIAVKHRKWDIANILGDHSPNTLASSFTLDVLYNRSSPSVLERAMKRDLGLKRSNDNGHFCHPWCEVFRSSDKAGILWLQKQGSSFYDLIKYHLPLYIMDETMDPEILAAAVYYGDYGFVQKTFELSYGDEHRKKLHQRYGSSALIIAVARGDLEMIQLLLELGCDPYQKHHMNGEWKRKRRGPLHFNIFVNTAFEAAVYSYLKFSYRRQVIDIISLFLTWNNSLTDSDRANRTALQMEGFLWIKFDGYSSLPAPFARRGIDDQAFEVWSRQSTANHSLMLERALQYATSKLYVEYLSDKSRQTCEQNIDWLLKIGAEVNAPAFGHAGHRSMHTPLQHAVSGNNFSLVHKLLPLGVDVNAAPGKMRGATALQFAALRGNFPILDLLLNAGADINAPRSPYRGRTAIEGAAESGALDMTAYLLQKGASVGGKENGAYRRAIFRAYQNGHVAVLKLIQEWKRKHSGDDDCEETDAICATMTHYELEHELGCNEVCTEGSCYEDWCRNKESYRKWSNDEYHDVWSMLLDV
ncbi:unnamed protein product [Periconia digitata]|uniref:Clr5 domain-containing protein n=1 Tax=Periconia digitata TaxID=1303443 RepID=A0A9W4UR24_9PLEO|nr:unnamed protein product [Periconia digitata]